MQQQQLWQQLLEDSQQMLEHAKAGEWDEMPAMAKRRHQQLERFFAQPVAAELVDEVAQGIQLMTQLDAQTSRLALEAKALLNSDSELLQRRRQASRAYTDPGHNAP